MPVDQAIALLLVASSLAAGLTALGYQWWRERK